MSSELNQLMIKTPVGFTQSRGYRLFMEPFVHLMRHHPETRRITITPEIRHLYRFSLESLLLANGVGLEDLWLIQRINNIDNSHDLDPTINHIILPNEQQLSDLKSVYINKIKK